MTPIGAKKPESAARKLVIDSVGPLNRHPGLHHDASEESFQSALRDAKQAGYQAGTTFGSDDSFECMRSIHDSGEQGANLVQGSFGCIFDNVCHVEVPAPMDSSNVAAAAVAKTSAVSDADKHGLDSSHHSYASAARPSSDSPTTYSPCNSHRQPEA